MKITSRNQHIAQDTQITNVGVHRLFHLTLGRVICIHYVCMQPSLRPEINITFERFITLENIAS